MILHIFLWEYHNNINIINSIRYTYLYVLFWTNFQTIHHNNIAHIYNTRKVCAYVVYVGKYKLYSIANNTQ